MYSSILNIVIFDITVLQYYCSVNIMGQIIIYLDLETEKRLTSAIKSGEISKSRWIADLIKEKVGKRRSAALHSVCLPVAVSTFVVKFGNFNCR